MQTPLYMDMRTREGCGLGSHMLPYIQNDTTIKARAANKHYLTSKTVMGLVMDPESGRHQRGIEKPKWLL